jgi:guanine deaminase
MTLDEAFCFATRCAGECFGAIGAFKEDCHLNALVSDESRFAGPERSLEECLERFCYMGDDRDIRERYVDGKLLEP